MRAEIAMAQRLVAEVAARQHGVISFGQLVSAGLTRSTLLRRAQEGWLHRVYRGVYALGNPNLTREGQWMAAVLACGEGAVLSHRSAAALWEIVSASPDSIHVTVPARSGRARRRGLVVHRSQTLVPDQTTRRRGIPVTSRARTLRDLGYGPEPTRSDLERAFLSLCRRHRIPKPRANVRIGSYVVDFLWPRERLVVETDGWAFHSGRAAFESDRARDRDLRLRGFVVLRFTYREVTREPAEVAAALRAHLRAAA